MFNAPRRMAGPALASSAFLTPSSGTATYADPLASSVPNPSGTSFGEGEVDPWNSAPSPAQTEHVRRDSVDDGDRLVPATSAVPSGTGGIAAREGLNTLISGSDLAIKGVESRAER